MWGGIILWARCSMNRRGNCFCYQGKNKFRTINDKPNCPKSPSADSLYNETSASALLTTTLTSTTASTQTNKEKSIRTYPTTARTWWSPKLLTGSPSTKISKKVTTLSTAIPSPWPVAWEFFLNLPFKISLFKMPGIDSDFFISLFSSFLGLCFLINF